MSMFPACSSVPAAIVFVIASAFCGLPKSVTDCPMTIPASCCPGATGKISVDSSGTVSGKIHCLNGSIITFSKAHAPTGSLQYCISLRSFPGCGCNCCVCMTPSVAWSEVSNCSQITYTHPSSC